MKQFIFVVLLIFTTLLFDTVSSIACYDCRADDSTCNVGECHGVTCVKMETANLDNGKEFNLQAQIVKIFFLISKFPRKFKF